MDLQSPQRKEAAGGEERQASAHRAAGAPLFLGLWAMGFFSLDVNNTPGSLLGLALWPRDSAGHRVARGALGREGRSGDSAHVAWMRPSAPSGATLSTLPDPGDCRCFLCCGVRHRGAEPSTGSCFCSPSESVSSERQNLPCKLQGEPIATRQVRGWSEAPPAGQWPWGAGLLATGPLPWSPPGRDLYGWFQTGS